LSDFDHVILSKEIIIIRNKASSQQAARYLEAHFICHEASFGEFTFRD